MTHTSIAVSQSNALAQQSASHSSMSTALNPQALIMRAIEQGSSLEFLERLLEIRSRLMVEEASKAFDTAMSSFQSSCPVIVKDRKVIVKGQERYRYADLGSIVKQVGGLLADNGFSYTVEVAQETNSAKSIITVAHAGGHRQKSEFRVPTDKDAYMSEPQKWASAMTFAKRIAFCNAFGILTGDDDDDNDISHPNKRRDTDCIEAEIVKKPMTAEHANMLARIQKLARNIFGTEDKWSEFLGDRDPAKMGIDDLRVFGSELQQLQAKKRPAPKPEIAEAEVVDLDQHHAEKSTGRRETLQKKFWATVRERLVMAGSYVGNDVVYWWLEKSGFGPYDEDLGRIRVSQMHVDDLGKACEYVASLIPADLVRAYTAEMEGR